MLKERRSSKRILGVRFEYEQPQADIPEDLRVCITDEHLASLAEMAARQIPVESPSLLALITYFYATGEFSSEEIEESLADCPLNSAAELALHDTDVASAIRHFRRVYRRAIEEALALVFRAVHGSAPTIVIQDEARSRIFRAIQTDCWALDD